MVLGALLLSDDDERQLTKRISRVKSPNGSAAASSSQSVNIRRVTRDSSIEAIDFLIKRLVPQPEKLRNRLASAGLKPALGPYLLVCAILGVIVGVSSLFIPMVPSLAALPIGLVVGLGLPHAIVGILVSRRRSKFIALFPDAIDLMTFSTSRTKSSRPSDASATSSRRKMFSASSRTSSPAPKV